MEGQARHFPMITRLVPCVLRRRPYQLARRRCDSPAQMLATRAPVLAPARARQGHLAVIERRV